MVSVRAPAAVLVNVPLKVKPFAPSIVLFVVKLVAPPTVTRPPVEFLSVPPPSDSAFAEGSWGHRLERITGSVMIGLGLRLALEAR